jgi:hypothetical protein
LLTVAEVMARYHLRDRRSARRLMDAAGSFRMGAGLFVRLSNLLELEESRRQARLAIDAPGTGRRSPAEPDDRRRQPLERGWWRRDDSEAA